MSKIHELAFNAEEIDELLDSVDKKTIYQDATQSEHGLMSTTDKTKLDALPTAQQIEGSLNAKVDKEAGKGLSKNDYTDADKAKVASALQTETDPTVPSWAKQPNKPSYNYSEIGNTPDLSGFITKSVNDLTNYYLKSETYTKAEVAALIRAIQQFHYEIYQTLPSSGESNVLYLIGPTGSGSDKYEEYVYSNNAFVKIGDTSIDLSGYVTTSALNTALADYTTTANLTTLLASKADKVTSATSGNFAGLDANGNLTDSGSKSTDFATAAQGAKADTAYQKPQTGIPESDLSSDVQLQLNKHFKGWFSSLEELKSAHTAVEGDSAYVKDASPATTWSIYVYDSTATTDNNWADSGTDADTSNVQTFASGEEVNDVHIVNDLTTGGEHNVVSAEQGKVIGEELYGEYEFVDIEVTLQNQQGYSTTLQDKIGVNLSNNAYVKSARIECESGDKFRIYGQGYQGSDAIVFVLYTFSDDTVITYNDKEYYTAIVKASAGIIARDNGVVITAPEGSKYLSINFYQYDSTTDKIQKYSLIEKGLISKVNEGPLFASNQNLNEVSIIDNFESDNPDDVFSAKQGGILGREVFGAYGFVDKELTLTSDAYYPTQNQTIGVLTSSPDSGIYCAKISATYGDTFKIFGIGNNSKYTLLYAFIDDSGTIIEKASINIDYREGGYIIVAPQGTVGLCINFRGYQQSTDKLQQYMQTTQGLESRVTALENQSSSFKPLEGKKIVVFGDSISEYTDNMGLHWTDYAAEITGAEFINVAIGGTQLRERAYPSYVTDNTNNTPNAFTRLFDSTETYVLGNRVYFKPGSTMNCYYCSNQNGHTGIWDDADFTEESYNYYIYSPLDMLNLIYCSCQTGENRFANQLAAAECVKDHLSDNNVAIIQRLIAIDWDEIDLVIVEGGANDYTDANNTNFGSAQDDNVNQTYSALNFIVKTFCSKYKNIPLYYISPLVHWFNYDATNPDPEKWSDVYQYPNKNITLKEFVHNVIDIFVANHITSKDLYNAIGWNMYNFSNFFSDNDGTHPIKGFRQLGQLVSNFLESNCP